MVDTGELLQAITLGAVILGAVVNTNGLLSKRDAQVKAETARDQKLDSILGKVEKIDKHQECMDTTIAGHEKRITVIETTLEISPKAG